MDVPSAINRQRRSSPVLWAGLVAVSLASGIGMPAGAEKVLKYDEEKGIIFIDKDAPPESADRGAQASSEKQAGKKAPLTRAIDTSLIRGKKKDPSAVYFESGLQYFKAGNYADALRLFLYADSTDPQPKYALWIGKTYRQTGKADQHIFTMKKILQTYPESDVADDALFEIAFSYQVADDYDRAARSYTMLAEQYPFGTSFSNGESFLEIAKQQKQMMRSEIVTTLRMLGYNGTELDDLVSSFQKAKGLTVSGLCDQKTVRSIKAEYLAFQKNEEKVAALRVRLARIMKWTAVLGGFNLLMAAIMIGVRISAAGKRKQLAMLAQTLADFNEKQL